MSFEGQPTLPSADDAVAAIPPAELNALRIVHLALGGGCVVMGAVFLSLLQLGTPAPEASEASPLPIPPWLPLALLPLPWLMGSVVSASLLRAGSEGVRAARDTSEAARRFFASFRAAHLVTQALREGVALFGFAVLFLRHVGRGALPSDPAEWLALVPAAAFLVGLSFSWPDPRALARAWRQALGD